VRRKVDDLIACPVCYGEGKVYRMTPFYESMTTQAQGETFGWTGATHEWRICPACRGSCVIHSGNGSKKRRKAQHG
jgi:hypothetical protein